MIEFILGLMSPVIDMIELSEAKKIRKSEAISAMREALRQTRKHIDLTREIDIDENYDDLASEILVEKWSIAARLIRPFDPHFASTLENKADYWKNPNGFMDDIQNGIIQYDYRFRLNLVISKINQLEKKLVN